MENRSSYNSLYFTDDKGKSLQVKQIILLYFSSEIPKARCPLCKGEISSDGWIFRKFNLKDKVITFAIGDLGFIFTRKICLGTILIILIFFLAFYNLNDFHSFHKNQPQLFLPDSWERYLNKCSHEKVNDEILQIFCSKRYQDKTITNWSGYVIRINDYRESFYKYLQHAITIFIKMAPSDFDDRPDVLLFMDSFEAKDNDLVLNSLERGHEIGFNATIVKLTDETTGIKVQGLQIWREKGNLDIPALYNENGRYNNPKEDKGFLDKNLLT